MKNLFYGGLGTVLVLVIGLVLYGTYLNEKGEAQITERMSNQSIPLRAAQAQNRNIKPILKLDSINLYSNNMADAVALIDGRITQIHVQKNDHVIKGQTLFTVTNETQPIKLRQADIDILKAENQIVQAENEIVKAETSLAKAKNDFNRYTRLREKDATTAEKYEEAEALYREAQVNLENYRLQRESLITQRDYYISQKEQLKIEVSYSQVTAPIEGEVLILYRPVGSYITGGTAVALIGDFKNLYFSMPLENRIAQRFSVGEEVNLNFKHTDFSKIYDTEYEVGNAGKGQQFTARLIEITPELSEQADIRKVLFEVTNNSGLLEPQTYSSVNVVANRPYRCLTIPNSALIDASKNMVFIVDGNGTLTKRSVITGADDGTYIEVLGGLKEGDIVVTSGTEGLNEGMKADITLEGGDING